MFTFIKGLNLALISALVLFVGFVSAVFFLGSNETYARLLENLPASFARRASGGIAVGVIGAVIILFINYSFSKIDPSTKPVSLTKMFWRTVLITTLASIAGTAIFFNH